MKYVLGFILVAVGFGLSLIGYFHHWDTQEITQAEKTLDYQTPSSPSPKIMHGSSVEYSASFPATNELLALKSLATSSGILKQILPQWYSIDVTGAIITYPSVQKGEIRQFAKESGIRITPSFLINWSKSESQIISSKDKQTKLIEEIMQLINENDYNGLDLNLEQLSSEQINYLYPFIEELSKKLKLRQYSYSLTVLQSSVKDDFFRIADQVRFVVYNPSPEADNPRSLVNTDEFSQFLLRISQSKNVQKTVIVVPISGFEWNTTSVIPKDYTTLLADITKLKGSWERDADTKEITGNYQKDGSIRRVWFEDVQSVQKYITEATTNGITSISFWYLGGEDTRIWGMIHTAQ